MALVIASMVALVVLGFAIQLNGPTWASLGAPFPAASEGQPGLGWGGFVAGIVLLGLLSELVAARGFCWGERFASGAVVIIVALLTLFVFFPIIKLGSTAFVGPDRFAVAQVSAAEGAALALQFFNARDTLIVEDKVNPQDIVSQADREVEILLRKRITAAFPDDAILGEEGGGQGGTSGFTWVIDRIDGTAPFLAGLSPWFLLVTVVQNDETVAGVIAQPIASEVFSIHKWQGMWLNGKKVTLGQELKINNCNVGMEIHHRAALPPFVDAIGRLFAVGGMFYRNGSGAVMLASVALGRLGGYDEPHMNPWDCLAGLLMVREAGGTTRPFPAGPDDGIVLAGAPNVYNDLAAICLR